MRNDLCASSGSPIPCGGFVLCLCGRTWKDHDKHGEPRFYVPMHDVMGHPVKPEKMAESINRATDAIARKAELARLKVTRPAVQLGLTMGREVVYAKKR